jgi:SAM-dependent methyltransferase
VEDDATNGGERASAAVHDWTYYAHLSIYHFALSFTKGMRVLDAGSGTGYGTAYLAERGEAVSVDGCDGSIEAVEYAENRFAGVKYHAVDLCGTLPFKDGQFDLIFTSNVMEHLADVDIFLNECTRILHPSGVMIIAVPPITSPALLEANIKNVFHVMNLTPQGWENKIRRFFSRIECRIHRPGGKFETPEAYSPELTKSADDILIREHDFIFPVTTIADLDKQQNNMTAIFLASHARDQILPPHLNEQIPADWHYGSVVAKVITEERKHFTQSIRLLDAHIEELNKKIQSLTASPPP